MKKAFTLVEIMVVAVVIGILLLVTLRMGWSYIRIMQVKNDKEEFVIYFNKIVSQTRSSSYYGNNRYRDFRLILTGGNKMTLMAKSGALEMELANYNLPYSNFSGFSGYGTFELETYKLECSFTDFNGINTGSTDIQIVSKFSPNKYCLNFDLQICKLKEVQCLP